MAKLHKWEFAVSDSEARSLMRSAGKSLNILLSLASENNP